MLTYASKLPAQYGFTNYVPTPSYGSEWGNINFGSVLQVPQWGGDNTYLQPTTTPWQNWQLGAYLLNTQYGVAIQQVVPGGLASTTGLKAGDVVVSVGGYQVGYVGGRVVDLVSEMSRRADRFGRVRLVLHEAYTQQLKQLDFVIAQSPQSTSSIVGEVLIDQGVLVPGNGSLKVEIQNISRPYLQVAGGSDYRQTYGNGPFAYSIRYNPSFINYSDRYRLIATLYDFNRRVVAYAAQDIAAPTTGTQVAYNLRLQGPSLYSASNTITAGYTPTDTNLLNQTFRQYLGRDPSMSESQAWSTQLSMNAMTASEMKAQLLSSPAFYDRAGNNPEFFVQRMIETVTGQPARYDQIQNWRIRLDSYRGVRLPVTREFLASVAQ